MLSMAAFLLRRGECSQSRWKASHESALDLRFSHQPVIHNAQEHPYPITLFAGVILCAPRRRAQTRFVLLLL